MASLPAPVGAADGPVFGENFGINVKNERITPAEAEKIAALGIGTVRIAINWNHVEREREYYDWEVPLPGWHRLSGDEDWPDYSYDGIIAILRERGLHVAVTLMRGNRFYTGPDVDTTDGGKTRRMWAAPRTPEAIDGFAKFAAATARHYSELYGPDAFTWLVWNEPDANTGFPPQADAAVFGELLEKSCAAIKEAVPSARVMGPALGAYGNGEIRHEFILGMFGRANPLRCLDAFTIHPYRPFAPETAVKDYRRVRTELLPWQPAKPVPVATDEWGYSINKNDIPHRVEIWRDFSGEEQAALMLRMYLTNLAEKFPLTVVYEWRDSGRDPKDYEHNFGMVDYDGEDKPAIAMMRYVWPELKGRGLESMAKGRSCSPHEHFFLFGPRSGDKTRVLAAWTDDEASSAVIEGAGEAKDIFGKSAVRPRRKAIPLSGVPVLVKLDHDKLPVIACKGS
ncbi:MAG: hypothetical protein WDO70_11785 [Alphaproteobacteria bacterium]